MNKSVRLVFDRKGSATKTGYGKIEIYVYLARTERKYEAVGEGTPDNWESAALDKFVVAKMKRYEQIVTAMKTLGEDMTVDNFNHHVYMNEAKSANDEAGKYMFKGVDQHQSFIEYVEDYLDKEGLRSGSRRNIQVVVDSLKNSGIIKTLYDLTPYNLQKYDEYLHNQGDKCQATICNYHKKIHKYTNMLWRSEMIPSDPYNQFEIKRGSSKERQPLTEEELLKLRQATNLSDKLTRVRDLFIFMAYTGLAYIDMSSFDFYTMTEKEGELYYIDGERTKTGSKYYTPILPPAMAVLEKYNFKLPTITNQKLNDYLHLLQDKLEINKEITCHVARHSFATLLLTYDFPIDKVARALGHRDVKTTQIYGKVLKKPMIVHSEKLATLIK